MITGRALGFFALATLSALTPAVASAQSRGKSTEKAAPKTAFNAASYDSAMLSEFAWRPIGPAVTSGRVVDLEVAEGRESANGDRLGKLLYAAAASGGVWKSVNAGTTWEPVFDKQATSSIGDIALSPSNPEIVWVGTGEANNQRSSSWGDGVYKSENGGKTWQHMGLRTSQHIGRIVVHPANPNIVYVAAAGPLWTDGGERGLYKSTDGGKSWKAVLRISPHTGVTDVVMDPTDPSIMYAAAFQRQRKAYSFVGGGPESGIYKSIDGGDTWAKVTEGLPKSDIGRIGLAVSRSQPRTVYATLETKTTEVYRSDDYGASWTKKGTYVQFPWYMAQIRVDPTNPDRLYELGVPLFVSNDGGVTNRPIAQSAHVDYHAMWIDPTDPDHFIVGNDGGVYITHDRGQTMDFVTNLPIAQYYAIDVDNRQPFYYVYGGLQDNNSWAGPSQTRNRQGITNSDWYVTVGGDGFYSAVDPTDPNTVYAESQNGGIIRYDVRTGEQKSIQPQAKFGEPNLRYNWSVPIVISPHDHNTVYFGAQYLFRSPNRGDSWERLGGDLTRALDRDKLPLMGKTWTKDAVAWHAGTADFGNISTMDESSLRKGLLYVGTDDGLIQVSRDGGASWTKIDKFPGVPEMTYVSRIVASAHTEGTVYATLDGHRSNDFKPYVLKSTDYGRTWSSIASNLPVSSVQVIREHPRAPSLLFAGNEIGAYYSGNGGRSWSKLQYNLPTVPVHDIRVQTRENDLVIGTHGRGIFIIDDITPLERLADAERASKMYLFPVKATTLFNYNSSFPGGLGGAGALGERSFSAPNPAFGATLTYYVKDSVPKGRTLSLAIFDSTGKRIRDPTVNSKAGLHRVTWDLRLAAPYYNPRPQGNRGQPQGALVLPGRYTARLTLSGKDSVMTASVETPIIVNADALVQLSPAEYRALHEMRLRAAAEQARVQGVVRTAELLKDQMTEVKNALKSLTGADSLLSQNNAIDRDVDDILTKVRGRQGTDANDADDKNRFTPSIQERVNGVAGEIGDVTSPPTQLQKETLDLAMTDLAREVARLNALLTTRVPALNRALDAAGVPWTVGRPIR
ncbi:MAG: glycosyl hydrolase [Gemmatimonadales bacterium]